MLQDVHGLSRRVLLKRWRDSARNAASRADRGAGHDAYRKWHPHRSPRCAGRGRREDRSGPARPDPAGLEAEATSRAIALAKVKRRGPRDVRPTPSPSAWPLPPTSAPIWPTSGISSAGSAGWWATTWLTWCAG